MFRIEHIDSGAITLELIEIAPSIDPERPFPRYAWSNSWVSSPSALD